tara:strand:+ start:6695 stop:8596 length:1902 start_codon:yes stop_codon:yes gene_type:complete
MSYHNEEFPRYVRTAGKITIFTAAVGLLVFMVAFVLDVGTNELSKVSAQTATTTLTVLNTPPSFTLNPYEVVESSTSSPTNSGDVIQWSAIGSDSNSAPYFLLICSNSASPTPNAAAGPAFLGTAPPDCDASAVQWGVSASTTSDTLATVSTTTEEWGTGQFLEIAEWYAWVCDDDPNNPRCNNIAQQGDYATSSSPFNINNRPTFTANLLNDGPADPAGTVAWTSTSTDGDTVGGEDSIFLVICNSNTDYNASLNTCPNDFIASTTLQTILSDAAATYTLPSVIRDDTYPAYGYIVDEHGHEATTNPLQSNFDVNNVAPTVLGGDIDLNGGGDITLTNAAAGETTGFTLDFRIRDANSCLNAASSSEISTDAADHLASVFRSNNSTTTCDASGDYDANDCYTNTVATTTWNISCTATTTCASPSQDFMDFTCTFPLWFIADPTDSDPGFTPAAFTATNWTAGVAGVDDDFATGTMATTSNPVELISAPYIGIIANEIAYGAIEPGNNTGTLNATSVIQNIGNTGLDQQVEGESMCGTFTPSVVCPVSATSTIPSFEQEFASTSLAYGDAQAFQLSSTTPQEVELDVAKTTSTSTYQTDTTYWGIEVPVTITLAGAYTGLNTFYAVTAEDADW